MAQGTKPERDFAPGTAAVTKARARLSVQTHRGADSLSGVHVSGRCGPGHVTIVIGHAPPYAPLRHTGIPAIDRTHPPARANLTTTCRNGRFEIARRRLSVRWSDAPLRARTAEDAGVKVVIQQHAIE